LQSKWWSPGVFTTCTPEEEAEADPSLYSVSKEEHDRVDVYETASQMYGNHFVHPYRNGSQYHESGGTGDEAEHDEFGDVRTSC